jgi:hypothetical protein
LRDVRWDTEADAIDDVLNNLPTEPVDGNQPEILKRSLHSIRAAAERIKAILTDCLEEYAEPGQAANQLTATYAPQEADANKSNDKSKPTATAQAEANSDPVDKDKLEKMILVCTDKKQNSWHELEAKHSVSQRTIRRWAKLIGYDLMTHEFVSPSAEVSALLDAQKKMKKSRSRKTK